MGEFFVVLYALLGVALVLLVYFIPAIVANKKNHDSYVGILLLNIFLGWSLIGWVVALVWAVTKPQAAPSVQAKEKDNHSQLRPCPLCAEPVMKAAVKCKHCGSDISPATDPAPYKVPTEPGRNF